MCQRWVGGSHTLLTKDVHRQQADFHIAPEPRVTAPGLGTDGRVTGSFFLQIIAHTYNLCESLIVDEIIT